MDENNNTYMQHKLLTSLILHILPGAITAGGFFLLRPVLNRFGFPPLLAFLLAVLLLDLPVMLGIMLLAGKRAQGRLTLKDVVGFQDRLPLGKFLLYFGGAFLLVYLLISLVTPLNTLISERLFSWLPAWIFLDDQAQYLAYGKGILIFTFSLQLILTGIVLPWVEELYFRGFLLPRLDHLGWWSPLFGGLFFAFYHVWQPYGFLTIFVLGVSLGYLVYWQKDLRLPISLHMLANLVARIGFLMAALSM
jgi:membrane protease YdiL (CAAX protease family)